MTDATSAIKPNIFSNLPVFKGEKEVEVEGITDQEKILGTGSNTAFWKVLKAYMEEVAGNLDSVSDLVIAQGGNYEEVGKNAIVVSLAKGIIKRIINKVDDSKQAIEEEKGK